MIAGVRPQGVPPLPSRASSPRLAWLSFVAGFACAALSATPEARAQSATSSVRARPVVLDLNAAVRLARAQSPTLRPSHAALSAADGVARAARSVLHTPPRLELQAGPRIQHGAARQIGPEVSVAAWQDVSLGGYGAAKRELSGAISREASAAARLAEWDAAARAALAWTDARLAIELQRMRGDALRDAVELLRVAEARVRSGRSDPGEAALAQAVLGSARAAALDAEGRRYIAEAELRFMTGLAAGAMIEVSGEFEVKDEPLPADAVFALARAAQPDLLLAAASAARRARDAELTYASGKPFLAVGPLVTREGTGDWIVQARVALPLPLVNPAAFEGARARSDALVAEAELEEQRARLEAELRAALHEREHARAVRDAFRDGALQPARLALDVAAKQYAAGRAELPAVLGARRELLDAEQRWAEAVADVRRADIRLARLLGRDATTPLAPSSKP